MFADLSGVGLIDGNRTVSSSKLSLSWMLTSGAPPPLSSVAFGYTDMQRCTMARFALHKGCFLHYATLNGQG